MGMVRMFHIECDAGFMPGNCNGENNPGDEWYASSAIAVAKQLGFHIKGDSAICADCWNSGIRFNTLSALN